MKTHILLSVTAVAIMLVAGPSHAATTLASGLNTITAGAASGSGVGSISFSVASAGTLVASFTEKLTGYSVSSVYIDQNTPSTSFAALGGPSNWSRFGFNSANLAAGAHTLYYVYAGTAPTGGTVTSNLTFSPNTVSAPVPEPETYALMLAGLGAVGLMARRRKTS